ncbi:unnamed protein product, partial [Bubo scandiacus]
MSGRQPISERFPTAPTPVTDRWGGGGAQKVGVLGLLLPDPPLRVPWPRACPRLWAGGPARCGGAGGAPRRRGGRSGAAPRGRGEEERGGALRCRREPWACRALGDPGAPGGFPALRSSPEKLLGDGASPRCADTAPRPPERRKGGERIKRFHLSPVLGGEPALPRRDRARPPGGRNAVPPARPRGRRRGAGPGWLPAGRSRPLPPWPIPLPLEFFHSAAPKRVRGALPVPARPPPAPRACSAGESRTVVPVGGRGERQTEPGAALGRAP